MAARFQAKKVAGKVAAGPVADAVSAIILAGAREAAKLAPHDTGNLAGSIQPGALTVKGTTVRGEFGTNVEYAAANEFGTHSAGEPDAPGKRSHRPGGLPARPYLRPGLAHGVAYARRKGLIQ